MIESIDHVNLVVEDMDAMVAFYQDALGLKLTKRVTISGAWVEKVVGLAGVEAEVVYLDLPTGPRVELIRYLSPVMDRPEGVNQPNAPGIRHFAFRVSELDALVDHLEEVGIRFYSEIQQVPDAQVTYKGGVRKRLVYFQDPEGNVLEFCEYA